MKKIIRKKHLMLLILSLFLSSTAFPFSITIRKDDTLKDIPTTIKVEIDGIPRTIGKKNFQNIDKKPFETNLMEETKIKISVKSSQSSVEKIITVKKAKIFTIFKKGKNLKIK